MQTILTMRHGSWLYGTATESSDIDIKEVFIPPARSILLGRGKRSVNFNAKASDADGFAPKNKPGDVDTEAYSLGKFMELALEGQTVAVEMIFATPLLQPKDYTGEWAEIYENRRRLMSKGVSAFLGYCRKQCAKYGVKGSRVAAARAITELLAGLIEAHGHLTKLGDHAAIIEQWVRETEHAEILDIEIKTQGKTIRHLSVCQKKAPYAITLKDAHFIYQRLFEEYGQRAKLAERNEGIDWKALSHAVRVGTQSIEYLLDEHVTFPRPDAPHLLKIKRGEIPYAVVAEEIEALLVEVEEAALKSALPGKPDEAWAENFIVDVYQAAVVLNASETE
jgi:hypothetical protein